MTTTKKRGRPSQANSLRTQGLDRHRHPRKSFHAPAELFAELADYIRRATPAVTESAVLRAALEEFLTKRRKK